MSGPTDARPSPAEGLATTVSGRPSVGGTHVPDRVGRYRIDAVLGAGSMGTVVAAYDEQLERAVAIKFLRGSKHEARQTMRWEREARVLASLTDPRIVQIYEVNMDADPPYLVMARIKGKTLRRWWTEDAPTRARRLAALVEAGRGLQAAHAAGVVHRDFKPDNVLIDAAGHAHVVDFGLARWAETASAMDTTSDSGVPGDTSTTLAGTLVGTPAYMAPEQHQRQAVDAAADQFAFCVTAWEALYGQRPFSGTYSELSLAVLQGRISPPPPGTGVPRRLARILRRGLAVDPAARWPSMHALLDAIERPAARGRWILGGAVLLAGAVGVPWFCSTGPRVPPECSAAAAQTQELWTPDRAARIDAVMAAPGDPSVRAQWQQARLDIEAWAKRLHVTRDALCNGPAPHIEATCVFDRRARLEVFLNELEGLGPHEVERAAPALLDAVASMRTPQTCLAGDTPIPLSLRPLRQALWSLETRIALHRPQAALAAWVPIAAEVEAAGSPALRAELRLTRGRLAKAQRDGTTAQAAFEEAYFLARDHAHPQVAIEAARELVLAVGATPARIDEARHWAHVAHAQAHDRPVERARTDALLAMMLYRAGEQQPSAALFETSSTALEAALGPRDLELWTTRLRYALMLTDTADHERARQLSEGALEIFADHYGPGSLQVANTHTYLGAIASNSGRNEEATPHFAEALAIFARHHAPDDVRLANARSNYGRQLQRVGRSDEAQTQLEQALAAYARLPGPPPRGLASTSTALAWVFRARGEYDRALEALQRALDVQAQTLPPDHPDRGNTWLQIAIVEQEQGRPEAARLHLQHAEEILTRVYGPTSVPLVSALLVHESLADDLQQFQDAARDRARIRAILEAHPVPDLLRSLRAAEAWALHRSGQSQAALVQHTLLVAEASLSNASTRSIAPLRLHAAEVAFAAGASSLGAEWLDDLLARTDLAHQHRVSAQRLAQEEAGGL